MTEETNAQGPLAPDDRVHKPADDKEEIYFEGSPLLRGEMGRLLLYLLIGIALIAIPIVWAVLSKEGAWWPWWVVGIFWVLGLIVILIPRFILKTIRYRISNYRIDYERGIFSKSIDTLELWHVDDIRFHQSLLDRILSVGTIQIISSDDTTPNLQLRGLPDPRPVFDALKHRVIAVKRQRGVIKMDVG